VKKEQLYHQIAHACLQVLKTPPKSDNKEQVKAVYEAIDQAFHNQFALLSSELDDCKQRLELIGELDETEHNLKDAQKIARQDSAKH
jgi:hypothetical protein|tara:strand:- start:163 stop:423 length:261 start_codon:yes stop_codon:yes gene_type:complete